MTYPSAKRVKISTEATFEVDVEGRHFRLNRLDFCRRSAFLKKELEELEARQQNAEPLEPVKIGYCHADDFATYLQCCNPGKVTLPKFDADGSNSPFLPLLRLYAVTYILRDYTIGNLIIDKILRKSDKSGILPNREEIIQVWGEIRRFRNPMRRLFVDYQIHEAAIGRLIVDEEDHDAVPLEYMVDVALSLQWLVELEGPRGQFGQNDDIFRVRCSSREKCYYHKHDGNHPECS